jgi:hypothetical protein
VIVMSVKNYLDHIAPTPDALKSIGEEAKQKGLHKLSMRQIGAEIAIARRERREKQASKTPHR